MRGSRLRRTPAPFLAAFLAAGVLAAGCGANVRPRADAAPAPVTITNCGEQVTYPRPRRPVAYDVSAIEKMFALGLAGRMQGYVMNTLFDNAIAKSPWRDDYRRVPRLGNGRISKEIVVNAKADWVMSYWGGGFSEDRGITPKLLQQVGVHSYVQSESCFGYGDMKPVPPMESVYTDLGNLGKIFGVEEKARSVVAGLRGRIDALKRSRPAGAAPPRVFVYDSGTDQPYTAGKYASPTAIIEAAGGRNVMDTLAKGWTTVGWEPVVAARPGVIIIVDYGDQPLAAKRAFLESAPALRSVPAVRDRHYFVLDYGAAVSGPRNVAAAEEFAAYLRSIGR
ncbi:iron transporter [Sphaerisporangium melleum]|uniref:Iron transporter n=1 Tax=Sphaerisporangium melleum TaxID=321316 RepID=A0A917QXX4_9ACTN|nr:ABC transporter substrate-binding protein [Sphaerisporangium melleum]GGK74712.1 iron transporter [Sphaerisporangium melleum]GII70950.1 iron transporter [Sphaerisporangium melleum]